MMLGVWGLLAMQQTPAECVFLFVHKGRSSSGSSSLSVVHVEQTVVLFVDDVMVRVSQSLKAQSSPPE